MAYSVLLVLCSFPAFFWAYFAKIRKKESRDHTLECLQTILGLLERNMSMSDLQSAMLAQILIEAFTGKAPWGLAIASFEPAAMARFEAELNRLFGALGVSTAKTVEQARSDQLALGEYRVLIFTELMARPGPPQRLARTREEILEEFRVIAIEAVTTSHTWRKTVVNIGYAAVRQLEANLAPHMGAGTLYRWQVPGQRRVAILTEPRRLSPGEN